MPALVPSTVLFVNSAFTGTTTGAWDAPYKTLLSAVTAAAAGDSIFIAKGLYNESAAQITINVANLTIVGGWDASEWSGSTNAASEPAAPNIAVSGDTSKYMTVAEVVGGQMAEPSAVVGNTTVLKLGANTPSTTFPIYIGGPTVENVTLKYLHIYSPYWNTTDGALIKITSFRPVGETNKIVPKNITLDYITFENRQAHSSLAYTRKCIDFNGCDGTAEAPNTVSNCYIPAGITYGLTFSSCHYVNVSNCVFGTPNISAGALASRRTPVYIGATAETGFKKTDLSNFNIATQKIVFSNNTWPTYADIQMESRGKSTAEYPEPTVGTSGNSFDVKLDSVMQYLAIGTYASNGQGGYYATYATTSYSTFFTNAKDFIGAYLTSLGGAYNNDTAKAGVLSGSLANYDIQDIKSGQDWYVHRMTNFGGAVAATGSSNLLTTVAGSRLTTPYVQSGHLIHYASGATIPAAGSLPAGVATISAAGVVASATVAAAAGTSAAVAVTNGATLAATLGAAATLVAAGEAATASTANAGVAAPVVAALPQVSAAAATTIVNNFVTASNSASNVVAFLSLKAATKSSGPDAEQDKKISDAMQSSSLLTGGVANANGTSIGNVAASSFFSLTYLREVVTPPRAATASVYVVFPTYTLTNGIYSATVDLALELPLTYYSYNQPIGTQIVYTYGAYSHTVYKTPTELLLDSAPYALGTEVPFGTTFNYNIYGSGATTGGGTTVPVACFVEGTRILSQNGYKPIEKFTTKDMLVTSDNRIINFKLYRTPVVKADENNAPYVIEPHAFGHNMPEAQLYLSARHMVQIRKGVWTCAEDAAKTNPLVKRAMLGKPVTYYHVECEDYLKDNVIAEGMVAESYGTTKSYKGTKTPYTWNSKLDAYTRSGVAKLKNVSTA